MSPGRAGAVPCTSRSSCPRATWAALPNDCQQTYELLPAKGVTFPAERTERPYGIEATLREDSGNMMSLVQPFVLDGEVGRSQAGWPGWSRGALL